MQTRDSFAIITAMTRTELSTDAALPQKGVPVMASALSTSSVVTLAQLRVDEAEMRSSAELCLAEAHAALEVGDDETARARALRSLSYSVGVFHDDYQRAAA